MGRDVLILGLGASGAAAAGHALSDGESVVVYAGTATPASRETARELEAAGARVVFDCEDVEGSHALCVASPGIPQTSHFYESALRASDELICEPEHAWRSSPEGWVGVTGTNGKTTTAALIAHILSACGDPCSLCGNTQDATATEAALSRADGGSIVCELSSFQLASTTRFAPEVGVLTNIGSDHLAWHGGQSEYARAKLRLFANMGAGSTAVVCAEVDGWEDLERDLLSRGADFVVVGVRRERSCAWCEGDPSRGDSVLHLVDGDGTDSVLCTVGDLSIRGPHNVSNALAAAVAARARMRGDDPPPVAGIPFCSSGAGARMRGDDPPPVAGIPFCSSGAGARVRRDEQNGISDTCLGGAAGGGAARAGGRDEQNGISGTCSGGVTQIAAALATFEPLAHRIESCGSADGIEFLDDSKATNTDAAIVAVRSFPGRPVVLLAGGRDKNGPLDDLVTVCRECCRHVVAYGEAQERFYSAMRSGNVPVTRAEGMRDAFDEACSIARPGDVVLLSPACASFDEFSSFAERGDVFKELVAQHVRADVDRASAGYGTSADDGAPGRREGR